MHVVKRAVDVDEMSSMILLYPKEPDAVIKKAITGSRAIGSRPWF